MGPNVILNEFSCIFIYDNLVIYDLRTLLFLKSGLGLGLVQYCPISHILQVQVIVIDMILGGLCLLEKCFPKHSDF